MARRDRAVRKQQHREARESLTEATTLAIAHGRSKMGVSVTDARILLDAFRCLEARIVYWKAQARAAMTQPAFTCAEARIVVIQPPIKMRREAERDLAWATEQLEAMDLEP